MSLDQLRSLQQDPVRRRLAELNAVVHAVTPVAVDFASTLLFYILLAFGADVQDAVILGVFLGLGQLVTMLMGRRRPSAMQIASVMLVLLVGGLTIFTNDARIMFWKVSVIYVVVGCSMLRPGWMKRHVPPIAADHLSSDVLQPWERAWATLVILTGVLNAALSSTQSPRTSAVVFGIFAPVTKIGLFTVQYLVLRRLTRRSMQARLELAA